MPIKSFRGQVDDGDILKVSLSTTDGSIGYRIVKFQCMLAGFENAEMVVKIYSVNQTTTSHTIDFNDQTLLAAALISGSASAEAYPEDQTIIFDNVIFNQDIYITGDKNSTANLVNWHIELEQVKLDLTENTVATLKDIRNIESQE
jgi:hypothetical protein